MHKRKGQLIVAAIGLSVCTGCTTNSSNQTKEESHQKATSHNESWVVLDDKDSVPQLLRNTYFSMFGVELDLANPGEPFNATDNLIDSLPTKQLTLLAHNGPEWRLAFRQGGFTTQYVLIQCKIEGDSVLSFQVGRTHAVLANLDSIDMLVHQGKLEPMKATRDSVHSKNSAGKKK